MIVKGRGYEELRLILFIFDFSCMKNFIIKPATENTGRSAFVYHFYYKLIGQSRN